jgi:uncharacterized protein (DUF2235 family)
MSKNVVFCADGTWNGPGQDQDHDGRPDPTNVFKTFANLDGRDTPQTLRLADEQERVLGAPGGDVVQVAKYLHGVGDSSNFLVRAVGGAGGAGLITRLVRGYTFVSRSYVPGDRIFLVGFSRGAYTARALAGLIAARGLLDAGKLDLGDKEMAYRLGSAEWFEWRRESLSSSASLWAKLQEIVWDLPGFLRRPPSAPRITGVPIEAVAVWDTVGSLGIPDYEKGTLRSEAFQFANTKLSPLVRHGLHAIAVDERRGSFVPTLWDAAPRIEQRLFPGAHSDVGGGYASADRGCGLADGALEWMTEGLRDLGVRFSATPPYPACPDPLGRLHEPWKHAPWTALPTAPRAFPSGLELHPSVEIRIGAGPVPSETPPDAPYAPQNLPVVR